MRPMDRTIVGLARALAAIAVFPPLVACVTAPARAQNNVDLQLVLAVDASGSVDHDRFELQKRGYAAAFRNPQVLNAIRSAATRSIAVTMVQWTGPTMQVQWSTGRCQGSAMRPRRWPAAHRSRAAAIVRRRHVDQRRHRLLAGAAAAQSLSRARGASSTFPATAPTIAAARSTLARDEAVADGVGINGLPILALEPYLDHYYRDNVIGGPGAFIVAAKDFETFADADPEEADHRDCGRSSHAYGAPAVTPA